ncbi:MAG: phosphatase PAP2 family protein [Alphaproteobacteria bacterium]|nr:phosphatase PAP2 family protein [Alphaproteobacteria bacterium]
MQKTLKIIILSVCILFGIFNQAKAEKNDDIERLGDLMMVMSPAYAWGMTVNEKDFDGTVQFAELMLSTQLAVEGIKAFNLEERPNHNNKRSFPSGHSAAAFSGAMFVHKRYGWKPALVPYAMGLITAWSRVETKAHYIHDTIAGAAISALFTWVLVDKYVPENVCINADTTGASITIKTKF